MEYNYDKIEVPSFPERIHARAEEVALKLCTISAAITELYALRTHYNQELDILSHDLSPGDAIRALIPAMDKGADALAWDDAKRTWDAGGN